MEPFDIHLPGDTSRFGIIRLSLFELVALLHEFLPAVHHASLDIFFSERDGVRIGRLVGYYPAELSYWQSPMASFLDLRKRRYIVDTLLSEIRQTFPGVSFQEIEMVKNGQCFSVYRS